MPRCVSCPIAQGLNSVSAGLFVELGHSRGLSSVCAQTVSSFVDKINAAGGNAKVFVYPGEGHAFMNAGEKIKEKK